MTGKPTTPDDSPARSSHGTRWAVIGGLMVVITTFGGFGTWAALAPLAGAVVADGVVSVAGKRKAVQHRDGGTIEAILIREGDDVTAGDVLLRLDDTEARVTLARLEDRLHAARAASARLRAERDGRPEIDFHESLTAGPGAPRADEILRAERILFAARRDSLEAEVSILRQRLARLDDEIRGLRARVGAAARQGELIAEETIGLRTLYEKGYAPKTRILALEREGARLDGERGQLLAEIARAETAIGETRLQILQRERRFRESVVAALRDREAEVRDLEERALAARQAVSRSEIRAPATGSVVGLSVFTIGGVVAPGETLLEIVPAGDGLVVEAQVRPVDIDGVFLGQAATVRFPAFKQRTTPALSGRVTRASADRILDARSGEPHYLVRIEIPDTELARLAGKRLTPGMPAQAMIQTASRTAFDYLAQPLLDGVAQGMREE